MKEVKISFGIHNEEEKNYIVTLLYNTFYEKFKPVFLTKTKSLKLLKKYILFDKILISRDDNNNIMGIAAIKYKGFSWLNLEFIDILKEYKFETLKVIFRGICLLNTQKCGEYLLLDDIVVIPDKRGLGIGTKIIYYLLDYAKKKKLKGVKLFVIKKNIRAKQLYEKLGFKTIKFHKIPLLWKKYFDINGFYEMILDF
ncbi:hypothetical protein X275_10455 [Marinitoga sp. 1197]|uniref:GNAT family N-acetyltransferase n=1 Tax=Marinitoga sp. 1197 TaxID=1428449 RepID=UPI000657CF00|nr:GNAT family N-acetyltransferase [Marinitoga sp. 1197]KLO21116.1 hypothetical protein X275_10455 [Marinitoga sp. 1197]